MVSPLPVVQPILTCLWARLLKVWSSVRVVHRVLPPVAVGPSRVHSPALNWNLQTRTCRFQAEAGKRLRDIFDGTVCIAASDSVLAFIVTLGQF